MDRIVQAMTGAQVAEACRDWVMKVRAVDPSTKVAASVNYAIENGGVGAAAVVLEEPPAPPPQPRREKAPASGGGGEAA